MTNHHQAKILLNAQARLGEGAIWHPTEQKLYWVDIEGKMLHVFDPESGEDKSFDVTERIGTVVPTMAGGAILALQNGIALFDLSTGEMAHKLDPEEHIPGNRFNDGKCDPMGNLWVGSMALDEKDPVGSVYKVKPDFSFEKMISGVTVSNGICWSLDGDVMYYIDSPTRRVVAYDFRMDKASISNPRTVIKVADHMGFPDGMTIDQNGMLWVALWGGAAVGCWNPKTGELIRKIEVPAPHVTSCAFGGKNLDKLYITSARQGLSQAQLDKYPHSGDLFVAEVGIGGVEADLFG